MSSRVVVAICVVSLCLLGVARSVNGRPFIHIVHNATESLPVGFYSVHTARPRLGQLVTFRVPANVYELATRRGYVAPQGEFLKRVVGEPGTLWCVDSSTSRFRVGSHVIGHALSKDSRGRALPSLRGCFVVPPGHVLVATEHPRSFDSRYFGVVSVSSISGVAEELWIYSR